MLTQTMKNLAQTCVTQAGASLFKDFKTPRKPFQRKSNLEMITKSDYTAERIILSKIKKAFPDHAILSEEAGRNGKNSDYLWVVDPLDGTTNFSYRNPLFGTVVALLYKNDPIYTAINCPAIGEFYTAEKGKGAFLNGKKIKVSKTSTLRNSMLTYCHGYSQKHLKNAIKFYTYLKVRDYKIRQLGAACIEFSWVAKGSTECYHSPGANPWDVAGAALIVREAGGMVTDFKGNPWTLGSKNVLGSNGKIHNALLQINKKLKIS